MKPLKCIVAISGLYFLLFPLQAMADEGHSEGNTALGAGTYFFLLFLVLLIVSAAAYLLVKNRAEGFVPSKRQQDKAQQTRLKTRISLLKWTWILSSVGLVLTGALNVLQPFSDNGKVKMDHMHGMGYTADGHKLLFAAHDGLKIYEHGIWSSGSGEKHDYMGFNVADNGFYTSGHPAPGSKLPNPFGVARSTDQGLTIEPLAYHGQIDFHLMAAGYRSHSLYIYNPGPLPQLKETGLYYSNDEGKTWIKAKMTGVSGEVTAVAAHPDQSAVVAVGTVSGLYVSADSGGTFETVQTGKQITGLSYSPQGMLYAGIYQGGTAGLLEVQQDSRKTKEIGIPALTKDAVAYISANPQNGNELAIATYNLQVFTSNDQGKAWTPIVKDGTSITTKD